MRNNKDQCPKCNGLKTKGYTQCRPCRNKIKGPDHPSWKGGKIKDSHGYTLVYVPHDPRANCGRYMKEHIIVMEEKLGRNLFPNENVHHKNGNRSDNRIENLELWVRPQPPGQRVEDLVKWAKEILDIYDA